MRFEASAVIPECALDCWGRLVAIKMEENKFRFKRKTPKGLLEKDDRSERINKNRYSGTSQPSSHH